MADDLMIEVTGSSKKAETALDRIIKKLSELQATFEKAAPSVNAFADKMNSIARSSKVASSFKVISDSANKTALSAKNAESKMAMYQARLDRANLSMSKSKAQSDKLAESLRKVSEAQSIANKNAKAFSMSPAEFANKFDMGKNSQGTNYTPETSQDVYTSAPKTSKLASEILVSSQPTTAKVDISSFRVAAQSASEYIDKLKTNMAGMSGEAQSQFSAMAEKLMTVSNQIDNQTMLYHNLATAATKAAHANGENSDQYLRLEKRMLSTDSAIQRLTDKQEKLKTEMSEIADVSETASHGILLFGSRSEKASSKATSGFGKTLQMMEKMLVRIAAFRIFSAVQEGITLGIQNMAQASSAANSAMSALSTSSLYLKNSIASSLMPAMQALTPVITNMINHLADLFNTIGMFTARIFNQASTVTIAKSANVNYAATIAGVGDKAKKSADAVKELQNSVLGFDELNTLNKPSSDSGTSGSEASDGMPSTDSMFKTIQIPQSIKEFSDKIKGLIQDNIDQIDRILNIAPFVIGAVLTFSGANIPLGLGLMAIGAVRMGKQVKEDWDNMHDKTKTSIDKISDLLTSAGNVELVLGAALMFSGANVPLGLGLLIGGITTMAITMNWDKLGKDVEATINNIATIVGGAALVLGAILTFTGANIPLGIGLMIGGATALAAKTVTNWDSMTTPILNTITSLMSAFGGALLAIGAILAFSGANLPLGIGLMATGAITLGSVAVIDWKSGKTNITTVLSDITAAMSGALLAVGAFLAFTGVNLPLGIGLIAVGALGLAATVALNWNNMSDHTKSVLSLVTSIAGGFMLALGLILCLTGAGIPLGIALMAIGGASLATAVAVNWNYLTDKTKSALNGLSDFAKGWWSAAKTDLENGKKSIQTWAENAKNALITPFKNISWPHISVPHIEWTSGGWSATGWIKDALSALNLPTTLPKLSVDWYAKGGVFDAPNVIGIGEAGPEAALPLNDSVYSNIADGIVKSLSSNSTDSSSVNKIIDRMDRLEDAIKGMKIILKANNRNLAESVNAGNRSIDRHYRSIAST